MDKETLYVVLPCYNEEENIENLIKQWEAYERKLYEKGVLLQIIVVNDGSDDSTLEIANLLESSYSNVKVVNHKVNKGLGEALNTGIKYVVDQKNKGLMCTMDADSTHQPSYIFSMIDKLRNEKLDCVIASRYRKGSKVEGLSLFRRFLSYGARVLYTLTFRILNVRDYTCGYRLYRIDSIGTLIDKCNGQIVKERSFACMMELLVKFSKEGFKIGEVPFVLKYQLKRGQSKMKVWNTVYRSICMIKSL